MINYLRKLPKDIHALMHKANFIASLKGMPVYLVGGFVRDLMLGVKNLDVDILVEGDGIKFAEEFSNELDAKVICHKRFGTATVILANNAKIDVATARKEIYPEPGSLPLVEFGTLEDDLKRRDFSINAMAINITGESFGKLIDFFNGKEDLENKKIRVLHNLSFIDDPTRILRAIRFEQRYDFHIETKTFFYLKDALRENMLERVQPQRLREELILMLNEEAPVRQIKRIQELSGLDFIKKGLILSKKNFALLNSVSAQIEWFKNSRFKKRKIEKWLVYFLALIDSLNLADTRFVLGHFVFRKGDEKRIFDSKKIDSKSVLELSSAKIKPSRVFHLLKSLSYENILFIKAKYKNVSLDKHINDFFGSYTGICLHISGHHLRNLGVIPGPHYQKIFSNVLAAKLNGKVETKEEELALIKKLIKDKYFEGRRLNAKTG